MKSVFTQFRPFWMIMLIAVLGLAVPGCHPKKTSSSPSRSRQLVEFHDIDGNLVKKHVETPDAFCPPGFTEDQLRTAFQKGIVASLNIEPTTSSSRVVEMVQTIFADGNNSQEEPPLSPNIGVLGLNVRGKWLYTCSLPGALCPYQAKAFISTYADLENEELAVFRYQPVFPIGDHSSTSLKVHVLKDQPVGNIFDFLQNRGLTNEWVSFVMGFYDHGEVKIDGFFKTYFIKLHGTNEWNKVQGRTMESWEKKDEIQ
ncbi:MAG: hypothetical protein ACOX9C_13055 [Kiritimatiellia bacterium]|jgi:hypothetical protein